MSPRPRLRPDVVVRRLESKEETYVIVKDPETRKYFKFEDWEYDLLGLLDGRRNVEELAREFARRHPEIGPNRQLIVDAVEELRHLGLLERSDHERHLVMMDRLKTMRKGRIEVPSVFSIIIPLFDPDRLMTRVLPSIRWWWAPWAVVTWLVVFTVVLGFLASHWSLYWRGFISLWNFPEKSPVEWVGFFVLMFGVSVWHELGHGFTCKRFGGEVHDIGVMLFYMQPVFYCGIDDSYLFPRLSHRIYAALGGVYFELMLCSVAAGVWLLTPAEWWIHSMALTVVFFTGLSAIVFNMNPLIKFDAYYILMDWLDVPNLREESFAHIGRFLKRRVFRLPAPRRPVSRRRRRIYVVYGTLSLVYTAMVLTVLYLVFRSWLVDWTGPAGYLLAVGAVGYVFRHPLKGFVRFARHLYLDKKDWLVSGWHRWAVLGVGLGLLVVAGSLRFPTRIESSFVVEPAERVVVRAPSAGRVAEVRVEEGDRVSRGEVLAVLVSPDLEASYRVARSRAELARRQAAQARRRADAPSARERARELEEQRSRLRALEDKLDSLVLRSPVGGVVSTPDVATSWGRHLEAGEELCRVDRLDTVRLDVRVPELEFEDLRAGLPVRILPTAYPLRSSRARVLSVAPVAVAHEAGEATVLDLIPRANLIRLQVEVGNPEGILRPGMTGRLQVLSRSRSMIGRVVRRLSRWAGSQFW